MWVMGVNFRKGIGSNCVVEKVDNFCFCFVIKVNFYFDIFVVVFILFLRFLFLRDFYF